MVFSLNTNKQTIVNAGRLSAGLPRSEVEARCCDLAQERKLTLQPAFYSMPFDATSREATASVTPSTEDGPFIVTRVLVPETFGGRTDWEVSIETGTKRINTGRVRGADAFRAPADELGAALCAPILVARAETLEFTVTLPVGFSLTQGDGFVIYGYHVRDGEGARMCEGQPEAFCQTLGDEGQLWMVGLVADAATVPRDVGVNASRDFLLQRVVIDVSVAGGGEVDVDTLGLAVGNTDITPQRLSGRIMRAVRKPIVIEGGRWPVAAAARIQLSPRHGTGAGILVGSRALLLGRAVRS